MCNPRVASLPTDLASVNAENFVNLSPEVLAGQLYGPEADMFGFGLACWEMLTMEPVYAEEKTWTLFKVVKGIEPPELNHRKIPRSYRHIIEQCLKKAPEKRIDASKCLEKIQTISSGF